MSMLLSLEYLFGLVYVKQLIHLKRVMIETSWKVRFDLFCCIGYTVLGENFGILVLLLFDRARLIVSLKL